MLIWKKKKKKKKKTSGQGRKRERHNIPKNAFLLNVKLLLHGVHYIQSG